MTTSTATYKRCSLCGETKPLDGFHRCRREKDGRQRKCKSCKLAENKEWQRANPQRMKEAVRRWEAANPERVLEHARDYAKRHPGKAQARAAVKRAIDRGELVRPSTCEDCGGPGREYKDGRAGIHAHHPDYSKPLDVKWLCATCHGERHRA